MTLQKKIMLEDSELPKQWYNLTPDLPTPLNPPLGPDGKSITPEMLAPVFPMNLIEQEVSQQRWIDIPEPILEMLASYRPVPLVRAYGLEKALGTPAKIFYKNESISPVGSHKGNTAIAQAWYNKQFGIKRLTTETGAGQWGSALAYASALLGLECKVFMVRVSFDQKPYRKMMMNTWGATCVPSPSTETQTGRNILAEFPDTPGSLGIAISEAIEQAVTDPKGETRYSLGSVLNHVMIHQSIIGLETKKQLAKVGIKKPDVVVGCCGGGSNFAGISFPFMYDKVNGADIKIVGIEPFSCPTLTKAPFLYDHGDVARMTPLLPMYSLGHTFIPAPIHAGGLRYHGMAPLVSAALRDGLMEARAVHQSECFEAGLLFAKTEGIIPAPETTHAIAGAIKEANIAKEEGKEKVIVFNFTGHGLLDLVGYEKYMTGQLKDYEYPAEEIAKNLEVLKGYPLPV
ncbi:MAG: TrpB-like pyridoxal phosphate-dependent enzyme [Prolixibacteraceae bacterium]|jgi:tryptophan synthase beta chain|nr:TrpB-like pyridoxal phosphate-dependent enzyme [Prolixibacteraceae bacterium]MDI9564793.1 TrpB-like pyridoxal phosphate-dependent enzyme [Bacteroidota bacterium]NLS99429.1 TrpB-like pyridoxal phosphate-dependent enzyme [Bacteroidales bacterium]HNZ68702.1 TrpB-like pyridoxal phosphate-dependent enzyme [Prolixibacteraceae bacterium]HOC87548.1 TrpB-like pyridoxal phosphate-dependent enzyme [Prolixibacteraceae bacterium]